MLSHVFGAVLQVLKPHQVEEVNRMMPTSTWIPDWLEPEGWWHWLPITSPPTNPKNCHELITPCSKVGVGYDTWGTRLLCSPHCLIIKVTFFVSSNSVSAFLFGVTVQRQPRFLAMLRETLPLISIQLPESQVSGTLKKEKSHCLLTASLSFTEERQEQLRMWLWLRRRLLLPVPNSGLC